MWYFQPTMIKASILYLIGLKTVNPKLKRGREHYRHLLEKTGIQISWMMLLHNIDLVFNFVLHTNTEVRRHLLAFLLQKNGKKKISLCFVSCIYDKSKIEPPSPITFHLNSLWLLLCILNIWFLFSVGRADQPKMRMIIRIPLNSWSWTHNWGFLPIDLNCWKTHLPYNLEPIVFLLVSVKFAK